MGDTFSEMQMHDVSTNQMHRPCVLHSLLLNKNASRIFPLRDLIFVSITIQVDGISHAPAHMPYSTFL